MDKYEADAFDEDTAAAGTIQEYEARIAALEHLVGKWAQELEFPRGLSAKDASRETGPMSVITALKTSPSPKDAD